MRRQKTIRLLLGGLIAGVTMSALQVQAQQVTNTQVESMVEALRQAAPKTGIKNDGLYSEWQVTPGIIPSWSKQCIGRKLTPMQFETSPMTARAVVTCITRRELQKQYRVSENNETTAVHSTACWWMTGNYTGCNSGQTATYVQNVVRLYQQARSQPPTSNQRQIPSPSPTP